MTRKFLILFSAAALFSACHAPKAAPKAPRVDEAVRQRAEDAQRSVSKESGETIVSTPAPETVVKKATILNKDIANNCTWVESDGLVVVGEQDTRAQVHAAAVAEARKQAMQDLFGVQVSINGLDYQKETLRGQESLTESILETTRGGRVVDEKVVDEGYRDMPNCPGCRYHVTLKSCIAEVSEASRNFQVKVSLSPRTQFVEGDEAKIRVSAARDCYVYVYDVGMDGETSLVVPNEFYPEIKLKAGQTFEYPDDETRRRGVKLVAQLPEGKTVSAETIRAVATSVPLTKDRQDPAMGGFLGILRRLNASRLDWGDDAEFFTIAKP